MTAWLYPPALESLFRFISSKLALSRYLIIFFTPVFTSWPGSSFELCSDLTSLYLNKDDKLQSKVCEILRALAASTKAKMKTIFLNMSVKININ